MILDEASYFTRRALTQLDRASQAVDDDIAQVHVRLSDLYLDRARNSVGRELGNRPRDNLVVLHAA